MSPIWIILSCKSQLNSSLFNLLQQHWIACCDCCTSLKFNSTSSPFLSLPPLFTLLPPLFPLPSSSLCLPFPPSALYSHSLPLLFLSPSPPFPLLPLICRSAPRSQPANSSAVLLLLPLTWSILTSLVATSSLMWDWGGWYPWGGGWGD